MRATPDAPRACVPPTPYRHRAMRPDMPAIPLPKGSTMTRWGRLLLRLGMHRHEHDGPTEYEFGVVVAHCRCGHDFTMPYPPRNNVQRLRSGTH
jgi:hypothetical protein